jgi:hypothetical protein
MEELISCPFCRKSDKLAVSLTQSQRYGKYNAAVYCRNCYAYGPRVRSEDLALPSVDLRNERITGTFKARMKDEAIKKWNKRGESGGLI